MRSSCAGRADRLCRENLGKLDRILDASSELSDDPLRPEGPTIRVGSERGPYVVVDAETSNRIVTYLGDQ